MTRPICFATPRRRTWTHRHSPNIIRVVVEHREEVRADHADLLVIVRGSSLVTGKAALTKAREVNQLVTDLAGLGVLEDAISLLSVHAQTTTGMLSKSSSASYTLRIRCRNLDVLADILIAITAQKNITLHHVEWGYPDEHSVTSKWLDECLERAQAKARRIAQGLGTTLTGIRHCRDIYVDSETAQPQVPYRAGPQFAADMDEIAGMRSAVGSTAGRSRVSTGEGLGMEVSHSKHAMLRVEVDYLVSGYTAPA